MKQRRPLAALFGEFSGREGEIKDKGQSKAELFWKKKKVQPGVSDGTEAGSTRLGQKAKRARELWCESSRGRTGRRRQRQ